MQILSEASLNSLRLLCRILSRAHTSTFRHLRVVRRPAVPILCNADLRHTVPLPLNVHRLSSQRDLMSSPYRPHIARLQLSQYPTGGRLRWSASQSHHKVSHLPLPLCKIAHCLQRRRMSRLVPQAVRLAS